ncbi:MAG: SDR family oxidoreductase [Nitrospirae bacterium]|nr:SDR family oxidoreductase [Nitrospirota bacterium]
MNSNGRTALVTGAAGGIGAAVAHSLLAAGLRVCLTDRDEAGLEREAARLRALHGERPVLFARMDVDRPDEVEDVHRTLGEAWGAVDVLVNNAGIFDERPFLEIEEEGFRRVLETNLLGAVRCCRVFGRDMVERGSGKIVNIASISAWRGAPRAAHYAASKAGLVALTLTLAREFAERNVQVNVVLPGYIDTGMMGHRRGVMLKYAAWRVPAGRLGRPEDVAEAVRLLVVADTSYLTGAQLVVDGGCSLG